MRQIIRNVYYRYRRYPTASCFNFAGLVLAMMAFFGFLSKLKVEMDWNIGIEDARKIYRVETYGKLFSNQDEYNALTCLPLAQQLEDIKGIEEVGYISLISFPVSFSKDGDQFSIPFVNGYAEKIDFWNNSIKPKYKKNSKDAYYVYVPKSFAKRYFGTTDVVGKEFSWEMSGNIERNNIAAVYNDFHEKASPKNAIYRCGHTEDWDIMTNLNYHVYVKIADKNDVPKIEKRINDKLRKNYPQAVEELSIKLRLDRAAHFSGVDDSDTGNNPVLLLLFLCASLSIIITCVNNINYSLAETPMRVKGANIRMVLGESKWQLRLSMIAENVYVCILAFILSMILMYFVDMYFHDDLNPLTNLRFVFATFIASILLGISSGLYPAFHATKFTPSMALKGTFTLSKKAKLFRNLHQGFQFVISFALTGFLIMMILELYHIYTTQYGFDKDNILYGNIISYEASNHKDELCNNIKKIPEVEDVSLSESEIGVKDLYMKWIRLKEGKTVNLIVMPVTWNYLRTMGIEVIEGRDFQKEDKGAFICNEAFLKVHPWEKINDTIFDEEGEYGHNYKLVGVCKNIQFTTFHKSKDTPMCFMVIDDDMKGYDGNYLTTNIRIKDGVDVNLVRDKIETVYKETIHDDLFETKPFNNYIFNIYDDETEFMQEIGLLSVLYIIITLIGTFAQTLFENIYRRKEIAIRKVFGATTFEITTSFCRHYLIMLVICFAISTCLIYVMGNVALSGLTDIAWYTWLCYPIAFVTIFLLVIGTTIFCSWNVAHRMPAKRSLE